VRPVTSTAEPQVLDAEPVARAPGAELVAATGALEHHEQEEGVVAKDRARVAARHGERGGRRPAARAGLASLEEVTEKDGVDLVVGVGLERVDEPVDVALD